MRFGFHFWDHECVFVLKWHCAFFREIFFGLHFCHVLDPLLKLLQHQQMVQFSFLVLPQDNRSLQSQDSIFVAANASHLSCVWFGCPGPLFWASFIRWPNMQSVNRWFFCMSHTLTTLTALQISEMSCSDRVSRGTGCWSKKFLCNSSRSHTTFQLWVPLWASLRLFTAENANYSQMGVKNVIKRDKHLWFLFEGFEVSALVTLYQQFSIYV